MRCGRARLKIALRFSSAGGPPWNPSRTNAIQEELGQLLHELPEWALEDGKLVRFWTFTNFVDAMAFVNRVAKLAEQAGHHPDIDIRYNRVKLGLVSHDEAASPRATRRAADGSAPGSMHRRSDPPGAAELTVLL